MVVVLGTVCTNTHDVWVVDLSRYKSDEMPYGLTERYKHPYCRIGKTKLLSKEKSLSTDNL